MFTTNFLRERGVRRSNSGNDPRNRHEDTAGLSSIPMVPMNLVPQPRSPRPPCSPMDLNQRPRSPPPPYAPIDYNVRPRSPPPPYAPMDYNVRPRSQPPPYAPMGVNIHPHSPCASTIINIPPRSPPPPYAPMGVNMHPRSPPPPYEESDFDINTETSFIEDDVARAARHLGHTHQLQQDGGERRHFLETCQWCVKECCWRQFAHFLALWLGGTFAFLLVFGLFRFYPELCRRRA